jgi:hypothetical protein
VPARGKGTRAAGGRAAAKPAASSTQTRQKRGYGDRLGLSPMQRVERARRISAARAKPKPDAWTTIGKREGITARHAQRIFDDHLTWERARVDPTRVMMHTLETVEAQILDLDDAIATAREQGNVNAWVGALRLQMEAIVGRVEVMRQAGLMPDSMRAFQAQQETQAIFEAFGRILRRHGIPDEVTDELLAVVADEPRPRRSLEGGDFIDGDAVPA